MNKQTMKILKNAFKHSGSGTSRLMPSLTSTLHEARRLIRKSFKELFKNFYSQELLTTLTFPDYPRWGFQFTVIETIA